MAYKCVNGMAPSYLCRMFQTGSQLHHLNTRSSKLLEIPSYRTATGQRSFRYRASCLWNSLPEWLKDHNLNLERFKSGQEVIWFNNFSMNRTELQLLLTKF